MDTLLDEPAVVLLALSLAAALFVIEVALPTAGLAGTLGLALGITAAVGIERQDADWWPLLGLMAAVGLWAVVIARRLRSPGVEAAAVMLFVSGSVVFGVLAESPLAAVTGVAMAAALGAGFPWLHERARRLLDQPARVGLEALVGTASEVVRWDGASGTVRLEGSLWNATSAAPLDAGDPVVVVGFTGSTLQVVPKVPHPTT